MLSPHANAMFGHTAVERQRRIASEQQLVRQEQTNGQLIHSNQQLHILVSILSTGAVVMLIVGAAIGSKTRRNHATQE